MIDFNFDYYKPASINEAVNLFEELETSGIKSAYYSGGTEIITFARKNDLSMGAVIDLKGIPEVSTLYISGDEISIGAGVTLSSVEKARFFPLLTKNVAFPADHTARNKITFGGNICGRIIYKEAVLTPLLLDARALIAGKNGIRTEQINDVFKRKLILENGEFLVQIIIDKKYGKLPCCAVRRTSSSKVSYPLMSFAAVKSDEGIRFAVSGVCSFPFRSRDMEKKLNETLLSYEERVKETLRHLPDAVLSNVEGGKDYREFVFGNTLMKTLRELGVK